MNQLSPEQARQLQERLKNMSTEQIKDLMKQQCLFCQISSGKIDSKKIYEDNEILAILDINPASKGHVLVFPKEHYQVMNQVPEKLVGKLFNIANKLSGIVFEIVQAEGTNIFVANGQAAGQNSPHTIIHLIPRFSNDNIPLAWDPKKMDENELEELTNLIKDKASSIKIDNKEKPKIIKKEKPKKLDDESVEEILP